MDEQFGSKDWKEQKKEILEHFRYDPEVYSLTNAGWWPSAEAYEHMPILKRYEEQLKRGKARIIIDYDPGYSKVILRIEKLP